MSTSMVDRLPSEAPPASPPPQRYWDLKEMCRLVRCQRDALLKLVDRGDLPKPIRLHGRLLWRIDAVEEALAKIEAAKE